jgi:nucleoside-diphosphate-sugar epimerase
MNTTTASPTVLIVGANGRFGGAATQAFAAAGWAVLAQARRAPPALPGGARHLAIDLADTAALAAAARGASVVVYAVNPPYDRWATEALPLARLGMDVAQRLGARFMLPGNVYNFGEAMPARLVEDTPQRPSTSRGRIRCAIEDEMAARTTQGLRSTVIRAGDFFGAGTGSWLDQAIVKSLAQGKLVYPGPLDRPHAWAYLPDLARSFVAAASRDELPAFARLHFAGHTATGSELLAAIERAAAAFGIAPARGFRHGGLPWPLIRLGALVVPAWRGLAEIAYLWKRPHALDGAAMQRALGPQRGTDLDTAMRDALAALAKLGLGPVASATITAGI